MQRNSDWRPAVSAALQGYGITLATINGLSVLASVLEAIPSLGLQESSLHTCTAAQLHSCRHWPQHCCSSGIFRVLQVSALAARLTIASNALLQAVTLVVWTAARYFLYASYFTIFGVLFGFKNFGKMVAIDNTFNGLIGASVYYCSYTGSLQVFTALSHRCMLTVTPQHRQGVSGQRASVLQMYQA